MFKNLLKKISAFGGPEHTQTYEDKFFSNIVGYSDVKKLLLKSISSKGAGKYIADRSSVFLQDDLSFGNTRCLGRYLFYGRY